MAAFIAKKKVPQPAITEHLAYAMGAKGAPPDRYEHLLFEAWMRGHCWAVVGEWTGKSYKHASETGNFIHQGAMHTRCLWAAWRDRAALSQASSSADASDSEVKNA